MCHIISYRYLGIQVPSIVSSSFSFSIFYIKEPMLNQWVCSCGYLCPHAILLIQLFRSSRLVKNKKLKNVQNPKRKCLETVTCLAKSPLRCFSGSSQEAVMATAELLLCPCFLSISDRFCKKQKGVLEHLYLKSHYRSDR